SDAILANFQEAGFGLTAKRRTDSGTVEAQTASADVPLDPSGAFAQKVLPVCANEDKRTYAPVSSDEHAAPGRQFVSYRSEIELEKYPNLSVPVIGLGGGIAMFRTETSVRVDFTVRKRLDEFPSQWRTLRKFYRSYEQEFAPWKKHVEVEPMFGYFELSKYE